MEGLQFESAKSMLRGYGPASSLIFGEARKTLITKGVFARLDTPAAGAHLLTSRLQQGVKRLFESARAHGISDPIVVGSIPFDTRRPSCLFVPERYRFVTQSALGSDHAQSWSGPCQDATRRQRRESTLQACSQGREVFQEAVHDLLDTVRSGCLQKVVLSRALDVNLSPTMDLNTLLERLLASSPSGYRFSIPIGGDATLVGISPELLLKKHGSHIVSNPLAGSAPRFDANTDKYRARDLCHSEKNLREHRVVVDQVRQILQPYCTQLSVPARPSLLPTTFLWHLSTLIEGSLKDQQSNALALACALHPTPAVCGYPTQSARKAIERHEAYDRGPFTGITGWMNAKGDGEWVVTIRCAVVRPGIARLFAGAGIVAGSLPAAEWEETVTKMSTMLQVLGLSEMPDIGHIGAQL